MQRARSKCKVLAAQSLKWGASGETLTRFLIARRGDCRVRIARSTNPILLEQRAR